METKIDINKAFTFVFEDKDWIKKILIAGALYITMVGAIPVLGWALEIQRRVIREEEDLLPDWHDIGIFTLDGLKYWLVNIIWMSPYLLLYFGMVITPIFFIHSSEEMYRILDIYPLFPFIFVPFAWIYMILYSIVSPVITGLLVDTDSIREALRISRVWKLFKANYLQCLGVAFLSFVANYAASWVGMILLFVGMFFTMPIGMAIMHHFFGQAYRNAVIKSSQETLPSQT